MYYSRETGKEDYMLVIAHRGANRYAPQNTLDAFRKAIEQKADGVETDVRITKDGHLVLCHNSTIKATSDGSGRVNEKYLGELFNYDFGSWYGSRFENTAIPTLDEFLREMKAGGAGLIDIELKRDKLGKNVVSRVIDLVRKYSLEDKVLLSSFDTNLLRLAKEIEPSVRTGRLYPIFGNAVSTKLGDPVRNAYKNGYDFLLPFRSYFTEDIVRRAHEYGIKVMPWTVNKIELIAKFRQWGVDGIITDYPDIMRHKIESL